MNSPRHLKHPTMQGDRLCVHIWVNGAFAGQPPQGPDKEVLNQQKPYPSSTTMSMCCRIASDRRKIIVLRKLQTERP